jgi:hypothetical protein
MYEYDYEGNKVYEVINGVQHIIINCDTEEENMRLCIYAKMELEHLKMFSLNEYVEMVHNGSLEEFLISFNHYEHNLENTIARQSAEKEGRAVTPMDEYMARLTTIELLNS